MARGLALLLLVLALGTASTTRAEEPEAAERVLDALARALAALDLEAVDIRVRDLAFWERYAPVLREKGRMTEDCALPTVADALLSARAAEVLRSPLEGVAWAVRMARRKDAWKSVWMETHPAPPPADPGAHDGSSAALDALPPLVPRAEELSRALARRVKRPKLSLVEQEILERWAIEGIGEDEVPRAQALFDRFREAPLQLPCREAIQTLSRLTRAARSDSGRGWPTEVTRIVCGPSRVVVVGTRGNDVFDAPADLVVDPGGDDRYEAAAKVVIDLGGNDRYVAREPFSIAAARDGLSLLLDLAGDDRYEGTTFGPGSSLAGLAILVDVAGDDVHVADRFAQGAAMLGAALVLDHDGDDRYEIASHGQGFARTGGLGVLADGAGKDRYVSGGMYESFYSQWTGGQKVTWSWAQGCSLGFYARYTREGDEGLLIRGLFPGGVGLLHDGAGDDVYVGSMWAQGTAYFYGLGLLHDVEGDDHYRSDWYGQGASAHFAAGILLDGAGNDRYDGVRQAQGNGRDFSTALCLDLAGDDVYRALERAQGCGDLKDAYGFLVDVAGDDLYVATNDSARGFATTADLEKTPEAPWHDVGVFLDLGGKDAYEGKAEGADGATWIQGATKRGVGMDLGPPVDR